ncbi:MAG TPA: response regulator [Vicinamibacterales bacterium]|nr:response regulator [Acidobacteriota bacterium]HOC19507.1 response regulator [Vicinamibacterales bacterium]
MRILIADDDRVSLRVLQGVLQDWGYDVVAARDGTEAWGVLSAPDRPSLAVLDWMMPGMDGPELCRRVRALGGGSPIYVILLTARGDPGDIVAGLGSGADDYVVKPFDGAELRARLSVGERVLKLQGDLADRVRDLEEALANVKRLQGLLPICAYCKKVRDDRNYWQQVEQYLSERLDARFSHSVCPTCYERHVRPEIEKLRSRRRAGEKGRGA